VIIQGGVIDYVKKRRLQNRLGTRVIYSRTYLVVVLGADSAVLCDRLAAR
jgi:hypothetical protein